MTLEFKSMTFPKWEDVKDKESVEIEQNGCYMLIHKSIYNAYVSARFRMRKRECFDYSEQGYIKACEYLQKRRIEIMEELAGNKAIWKA